MIGLRIHSAYAFWSDLLEILGNVGCTPLAGVTLCLCLLFPELKNRFLKSFSYSSSIIQLNSAVCLGIASPDLEISD